MGQCKFCNCVERATESFRRGRDRLEHFGRDRSLTTHGPAVQRAPERLATAPEAGFVQVGKVVAGLPDPNDKGRLRKLPADLQRRSLQSPLRNQPEPTRFLSETLLPLDRHATGRMPIVSTARSMLSELPVRVLSLRTSSRLSRAGYLFDGQA